MVLAIALDRLSQAFAERRPVHTATHAAEPVQRYPYLHRCSRSHCDRRRRSCCRRAGLSRGLAITTGTFWAKLVAYINVNYFDELEAVKTALLLNF